MFLPPETSMSTMQRKYKAAITYEFCNEVTTTMFYYNMPVPLNVSLWGVIISGTADALRLAS